MGWANLLGPLQAVSPLKHLAAVSEAGGKEKAGLYVSVTRERQVGTGKELPAVSAHCPLGHCTNTLSVNPHNNPVRLYKWGS